MSKSTEKESQGNRCWVMMTDDEVVVVVKGKSKSHFGKVGDSGRHRVVHCGTVQSYPTILPSDISM